MTHLEIENLASDYLEGLLEPSQQAAVEAHLAECAACRELLADVSHVLEICRAAQDAEPKPWLVSKIMLATVGERKPTWREQIAAYLRPLLQPRVAYPIAMTVFTFSVIVNAAGLNLRSLRFEDLNPLTWASRADRQRHLVIARVEKFCYDLRMVVEIESRLRQMSGKSQMQEEETPKPTAPRGGSSQGTPSGDTMSSGGDALVVAAAENEQTLSLVENHTRLTRGGRSQIP